MTKQEAKRWLGRGYRTRERIKAKSRRIDNWRDLATSITSAWQEVATAPSMPGKKVERYAVEIADMQLKIAGEIEELKDIECEISEALKTYVDIPNYLVILEMRYLSYMRWEEIAEELHFTVRWVMTLHERAVKYFAEKAH